MSFPKGVGGLGFREFGCLNDEFLTKQLWRLIDSLITLAARILRAKYFPGGLLTSADVAIRHISGEAFGRRNPLQISGIRWRVGTWQNIRVIGDPWIPSRPGFRLDEQPPGLPLDARISDLIDMRNQQWNQNYIRDIFTEEVVQQILSMPLGSLMCEDHLVWNHSNNGLFSVESAYHYAFKHRFGEQNLEMSNCRIETNWAKLGK